MRTYLTIVMLALALGAEPSSAAVESMTVQVDGLVCPFCVYGLEKQLKKLSSVEGVRVDVDAGHAVLQLAETARLVDPEDPGSGLIAAVREVGSKSGGAEKLGIPRQSLQKNAEAFEDHACGAVAAADRRRDFDVRKWR